MVRKSLYLTLLSTTAVGVGLAVGFAGGEPSSLLSAGSRPALAQNPCAAKPNPCAAKNPSAAKNPCAAGANPCNPCAGASDASFSTKCVVPRLQQAAANPCAAKANPCGANPCAAKANPCAAKANPCAAKANPCAAKANPCAAKNPCGAAANPCNPCSPCGAATPVELADAEAKAVSDCMLDEMLVSYAKSPLAVARNYSRWAKYSTQAYQSATHGQRFVRNYGNDKARNYARYEQAGKLPTGAVLVKDSFMVTPDGRVSVGPLFLMEKMQAGFLKASADWKYTMIMPDGTTFGETKGKNSAAMQFCIECHQNAREHDDLMFVPADYRVKR